jgi:hypothetical protein
VDGLWHAGPKTGWEAVFLGAQAGSIASSIAFTFVIANAAGVFALSPILKILPRFMIDPHKVVVAVTLPTIALFRYTFYTWLAIELAGILLGLLGCLFHMWQSGYKISLSGFNLTFDICWWKMILGGIICAILILPLSSIANRLLVDEVAKMASRAGYAVVGIDRTLLDWFPTIHPLLVLLSVFIIACISTLGKVPDDYSQQRTIALYAIVIAILPWVGPTTWFYSYTKYDPFSAEHIAFELLSTIASIFLIFFSFRLIRKTGWGKIVAITGRHFWVTQTENAFVFILLATPTFLAGWFYTTVVDISISILNGTSNISAKEMMTITFEFQLLIYLFVFIIIWIIYALLGALLKPFIWVFNGIVSLFPTQVSLKIDSQPEIAETVLSTTDDSQQSLSLAEKIQDSLLLIEDYLQLVDHYLQLKENSRFFKAIGFIVGIPLILVIGLWIFSGPTQSPVIQMHDLFTVTSSPTDDLFGPFLTQLGPPTNTPTILPYFATKRVAVAFTQLAIFAQATRNTITPIPTSTSTSTATSITTLTPTGNTLVLDKSQVCHEGPGKGFQEVTTLASGVRLPILLSFD